MEELNVPMPVQLQIIGLLAALESPHTAVLLCVKGLCAESL